MTLDLQVIDVMIARYSEEFDEESKIESLAMSIRSANAVVPSKDRQKQSSERRIPKSFLVIKVAAFDIDGFLK